MSRWSRRRLIAAGGLALGAQLLSPAVAQGRIKLRFSSTFTGNDLRVEAYRALASAIDEDFDFEPYWGNTLHRQGTELIAMQRGNLELCNLGAPDIARQIPAWSLLNCPYLFRDTDHLKKTFKSEVGAEFIKMARDQLGIEIVTTVFFGVRNLNLRTSRTIRTPADLRSVKLRMPPGEYWQFVGESLGANPTPVAYAELYLALQAGAIDAQDNPLSASKLMKFDEVTSQFVLTQHLLAYDVMCVRGTVWDELRPQQREKFRRAAEAAMDQNTAKFNAQEAEAIEHFKREGKKVYAPDRNAFRIHAQRKYMEKYGEHWPKGALERISAVQ